ncbi:hypothetical protein FGO68_gene13130 [Halteria grandinella]|uniref:CSD domain-containing protein n=1 Tax=Halteria grandinella TaxID=5974 RepID=A0A8J8NZP3_HALGN|nr:hypothetical protein FGO68_gene13130 [Halteria grandinella]
MMSLYQNQKALLIEKLREDVARLLQKTQALEDLDYDATLKDWLSQRNFLLVETSINIKPNDDPDPHSILQESRAALAQKTYVAYQQAFELFSILVSKTKDKHLEIRQYFLNFLQQIDKEFDLIFRDQLDCTGGLSCQELIQVVFNVGGQNLAITQKVQPYFALELTFVILSYLVKKNVRFHWFTPHPSSQGSNGALIDHLLVNEMNVNYDPQDQSCVKVLLTKQTFEEQIHLQILCNQYEYKILFQMSFPTVLISPDSDEERKVNQQVSNDAPPGLENMILNQRIAQQQQQQNMSIFGNPLIPQQQPQLATQFLQQQQEIQKAYTLLSQQLAVQQQQLLLQGTTGQLGLGNVNLLAQQLGINPSQTEDLQRLLLLQRQQQQQVTINALIAQQQQQLLLQQSSGSLRMGGLAGTNNTLGGLQGPPGLSGLLNSSLNQNQGLTNFDPTSLTQNSQGLPPGLEQKQKPHQQRIDPPPGFETHGYQGRQQYPPQQQNLGASQGNSMQNYMLQNQKMHGNFQMMQPQRQQIPNQNSIEQNFSQLGNPHQAPFSQTMPVQQSKSENKYVAPGSLAPEGFNIQPSQSLDIKSQVFVPSSKKKQSGKSGQDSQKQSKSSESDNVSPLEGGAATVSDTASSSPAQSQSQGQQKGMEYTASKKKATGRVKFFMEPHNYGFIVSDESPELEGGLDLFFHYDDMKKTNLSRAFLKDVRDRFLVRVKFRVMAYHGKYNMSKKAVDIELIKIEPLVQGATLPPTEGVMPPQQPLPPAQMPPVAVPQYKQNPNPGQRSQGPIHSQQLPPQPQPQQVAPNQTQSQQQYVQRSVPANVQAQKVQNQGQVQTQIQGQQQPVQPNPQPAQHPMQAFEQEFAQKLSMGVPISRPQGVSMIYQPKQQSNTDSPNRGQNF